MLQHADVLGKIGSFLTCSIYKSKYNYYSERIRLVIGNGNDDKTVTQINATQLGIISDMPASVFFLQLNEG